MSDNIHYKIGYAEGERDAKQIRIEELVAALKEIAEKSLSTPADNLLFFDSHSLARRLWGTRYRAEQALKGK